MPVGAPAGPVPAEVGDGCRHRVRRAWPAGDHVVVELVDAEGRVTPGRWLPRDGVSLGAPGEDPGLPGLAGAVRDGGTVVGHRAGRRAVARTRAGFVKVVRPGRLGLLVARHRAVAAALASTPGAFTVPRIVAVDAARGTLTLAAAGGRPLLDCADPAGTARRAGAALRRVAEARPDGLVDHTAEDEIEVLHRWHAAARRFDTLPTGSADRHAGLVAEAAARLRHLRGRPLVPAHRDLHDGQILHDGHSPPVLLDLDTAARADPALDVGNLLAHVDLARHEGRITAGVADGFVAAFVGGRAPAPHDAHPIAVYRQAAALRLVAVHSFRPATRPAALGLLADLAQPGSTKR